MFGQMSVIISSAVDNGASYYNIETILDTVSESHRLSSTRVFGYKPDRKRELCVEVVDSKALFSGSILLTVLAFDCKHSDSILSKTFKHSGYGLGQALKCS